MPILYIVRGLPGSGKSTKAKSFGCLHVEADMFFIQDSEYKWSGDRVQAAHNWCKEQVQIAMVKRMDVAVSNTFTQLKEFRDYMSMAMRCGGYDIKVIRCMNNFGNIHEVPEESLKRMADRFEDYEGEEIYVAERS